MPHFEKNHPVEHSAQDMFDLVADIDRYPEFVPLCQALNTTSVRKKAGREIRVANLTAGYMAIKETFTCQVVLNRKDSEIFVSYIDGPFKFLENKWKFEETGNSDCNIHFSLDYEFKSMALSLLMGSMFDRAFAHFTQAFEERANELFAQSKTV